MNVHYQQHGYVVIPQFLNQTELDDLRQVIGRFHTLWKQQNAEFYATQAVNSAYLTHKKYLEESDRLKLFQLIGSDKLMRVVSNIFDDQAAFMNTQLFFNPVNSQQKNYWHRDPQYHLSLDEQKAALKGPNVVHFRLPLFNEPGIELIPGTHRRWDTNEELDVRMQHKGRKHYQSLPSATAVPLQAADLLVFSANMIHRGLYGGDRLALDILFCEPNDELLKFVDPECLPARQLLSQLDNPSAMLITIEAKTVQQNCS